jgi:hypothetical protein
MKHGTNSNRTLSTFEREMQNPAFRKRYYRRYRKFLIEEMQYCLAHFKLTHIPCLVKSYFTSYIDQRKHK